MAILMQHVTNGGYCVRVSDGAVYDNYTIGYSIESGSMVAGIFVRHACSLSPMVVRTIERAFEYYQAFIFGMD
jgi:hypothetical protein